MKGRLYHICFTSHSEVLCRQHLDYVTLINSLLQAAINTDSLLIAFVIMSSHVHIAVITSNPGILVQRIRSSYTQQFNDRYFRKGRMGDKYYFKLAMEGRLHITAAFSYIMRNPVHHRVCANPFAYPYSTIHMYFNSQKSPQFLSDKGIAEARMKDTIRKKNILPAGIQFDLSGMIDLSSVVNTEIFEGYFGSYRAFHYGLSRNDYDNWQNEQIKELSEKPPVTLSSIEPHLPVGKIKEMMAHNTAWLREVKMTDMELCEMIDGKYISDFHRRSYAELTDSEKIAVAQHILENKFVPITQLARCLSVRPEVLLGAVEGMK